MTNADAAQCEKIRLAIVLDNLGALVEMVRGLAKEERETNPNPNVSHHLIEAENKLKAAMQTICLDMRSL